jgi:hypothetical protein
MNIESWEVGTPFLNICKYYENKITKQSELHNISAEGLRE